MKEAEDYLENEQWFGSGAEGYYRNDVVEMIEKAQKDVIEYALNEAAKEAKAGYMITARNEPIEVIIDKNSILSLKDKLFKEVDNERS